MLTRIKVVTGTLENTAEFEKQLNCFLDDGWMLVGNLLIATDSTGRGAKYVQMIGYHATGSGGK